MKNVSIVKALAVVGLVGLFVVAPSSRASADLVFNQDITTTGNGLGAVATIVTVHDSVNDVTGAIVGNGDGTESGCINQDGSFTDCLGDVAGGDNIAQNNVQTLSNTSGFAAVVNISETGQDVTVVLTDLYLTFCGTNGCHTAFYDGPDLTLTQGTGTGIGGAGFVFTLDAAQALIVSNLGGTLTISGGVQFGPLSTNDGNDTLFVARVAGPENPPIPEPASMILLGTGLVGASAAARRRRAKKA